MSTITFDTLEKFVGHRVRVTWDNGETVGLLTAHNGLHWLTWDHPKSGRPMSMTAPARWVRAIRDAEPGERDGDYFSHQ